MITTSALTRRFGATTALAAITLEVPRGEMFALIGPDGAGKTTFFRLVAGVLAPTSGTVTRATGTFGLVPQRFGLYQDLSIDENIAFFAEIHGLRRYYVARDRLLAMTQLTPFRGRRADRLSGGMKQKLALACTLVHEPDVLLLDEPTTGVDPVSRREFWKLLSEFLASGLTIVMATPYLDEAERCGRVVLLHEGRVLALERPEALQHALAGRLLEVATGSTRPPIDLLMQVPGVDDVQAFGDRAHVRLSGVSQAEGIARVTGALERAGIPVQSARPVAASLEDVFIDLVTGQA